MVVAPTTTSSKFEGAKLHDPTLVVQDARRMLTLTEGLFLWAGSDSTVG